jgi:death-on-curing protein
MNHEPRFLSINEVIEIHDHEIAVAGGSPGIRDLKALESALGAAQASFSGQYLMDIFQMAATYVHSIAMNHPFMDGNKRTALASGLVFLYINGYAVIESYDEELADKILDLVTRKISKSDFADHLRSQSEEIR